MKTRVSFLLLAAIAATAIVAFWPSPDAPPAEKNADPVPSVAHGPEPTIGGFAGGQIATTANFWADDSTTPPERLAYSVSIDNLKNLSTPPSLSHASEVRVGKRWVSVSLDFPYGTVTEDSSIDLTVKFTNGAGRSASKTMTIDRN